MAPNPLTARISGLPARVAVAATRRAPWVVLAWLVAAAAALYVSSVTLSINTDTEDLVSDELPFRQAAQALKAAFPHRGSLLVLVVSGPVPELVELAAARLATAVEADKAHFDSVHVPGADPFFARNGLLFLDLDQLEDLVDRLAELQPFLARVVDRPTLDGLLDTLTVALDEASPATLAAFATPVERVTESLDAALTGAPAALSWRSLIDGAPAPTISRRVVVVQAVADYEEVFPFEAAIEAARSAGATVGIGEPGALRLGITGSNAVEHEDLISVSRGAGLAAIVALLLVTVVLIAGLRSVRVVLAAVLTLLGGLALTVGFAAVFVGHLNLISIAFAVLYIGLGIDAAIHFAMRFQELARNGTQRSEALRVTARDIAPALTLCAVTTAVGFYAFIPTAYAGVAELGLIGGSGMFISLIAALTLLPALLALLTPAAGSGAGARAPARVPPLAGTAARRGAPTVTAAAVVGVLGLVAASGVHFSYDPIELSNPANESIVTLRALSKNRALFTAAVLAPDASAAARLSAALDALPEVDSVTTLLDFVPSAQREKLELVDELALTLGPLPGDMKVARSENDASRRAIARYRDALGSADAATAPGALDRLLESLERLDSRLASDHRNESAALLARIDEALFATLPHVLSRLRASLEAGPVAVEDVPPSIARRWLSPAGLWRLEVTPDENLSDADALARFVDAVLSVAPGATDGPIEVRLVGQAIVVSFVQAFLTALLVIGALLWLELRSVRDAALVLLPLAFGAVLLNATMALTGIGYNFANLIALPLLLGIGVDNGVHVVKRARDGALGSASELRRSSTARAVVISALTTIVSFGSLGLSAHPGTASMGWVLTIGMVVLVLAALVLLPPLLKR